MNLNPFAAPKPGPMKSYLRGPKVPSPAAAAAAFTPDVLARLYDYPKVNGGVAPAIAIGELGGGYDPADVQSYFGALGLPMPTITEVGVRGASNSPGGDADVEVALDIQVVAAAYSWATGLPAELLLVWAPNDDNGIADAITAAASHPLRPVVMSWSWGAPEDAWADAAVSATEAALVTAYVGGMVVTAAAGDNGSGDGEPGNHVDYPASSPSVLACGGTTVQARNGVIARETVWNDGWRGGSTGGGYSSRFNRPAYQALAVSGRARGVPDVAANADPHTGYKVLVNGGYQVVGGTSAVAPLVAALVALFSQKLNKRFEALQPQFYANQSAFRDVMSGNNGAFRAGVGWDADTGLGSPDGAHILSHLS